MVVPACRLIVPGAGSDRRLANQIGADDMWGDMAVVGSGIEDDVCAV